MNKQVQVSDVYNLRGTIIVVKDVRDTRVTYMVCNNGWAGQYVTVSLSVFKQTTCDAKVVA